MYGLNEQISEAYLPSSQMSLSDTLTPGTLLRGHSYQIHQIIGRGSFGITYSASHTFLGNTVAIKEYFPSQYVTREKGYVVVSSNEYELAYKNGLQQFIQEGQILANIHHPNIVQVKDLFEEGDTAYLVMDLVNGHSLHRELELQVDFKLPISRVTIIAEQIVEALKELHEAGIYHLDIKPQNILLTPEDQAILIDFGAARGSVNANKMGSRSFTEAYAPPELTTGGKLGAYSDIFEVGMVLYQMLTGTLPPPAYKRLFEGENWQPIGLQQPWQDLIKVALILNPLERPQIIEEWWHNYYRNWQKEKAEIILSGLNNTYTRFVSPILQSAGMQQRLGRGSLKKVFSLGFADYVLVCSAGGTALMSLLNGEILTEIDSPTEKVAFNRQQSLLALVWQQKIYIWNIKTGQLLQELQGHERPIFALAFSPDGSLLVSTSADESIVFWDLTKPGQKKTISLDYALVFCLAFSPDGRYLALGTSEGNIKLLEVETLEVIQKLLQGHKSSIESLVFNNDGSLIASGGRDGLICLWKVPTDEKISVLEGHTDWVTSLAFSPDDCYLASGGSVEDKTIRLWDFQKEGQFKIFKGHTNSINSLTFLEQGLVSSSYDNTIRVWQILDGEEIAQFKQHTNWIYSIACSPNHSYIISGHNDQTIRLWEQDTEKETLIILGHQSAVATVDFHPQGLLMASGGWDNTVCLWDATNGQLIRSFKGHQDWIKAVCFSPDGTLLATASRDATVRFWRVATSHWFWHAKRPLRILKAHLEGVACLAFAPNGHVIATGGNDQIIRLWEVASGQEIISLEGHSHHINSISFTIDGQFLISASSDKTIRLWSVSSGEVHHIFRGHTRSVNSIAVSPDGQWLVSGGSDHQVFLWDLISQNFVKVFLGHTHRINSVDFTPDSKSIVSADHDGVIRIWEI